MNTGKIKVIHYFNKPISCSLYINTFQCSTAQIYTVGRCKIAIFAECFSQRAEFTGYKRKNVNSFHLNYYLVHMEACFSKYVTKSQFCVSFTRPYCATS